MVCFITNNGKETGVKILGLDSIEYKDGVIIINDILELLPEEIVEIKIIREEDENMKEEKIIKEYNARKKMIRSVESIIRKYKNVELIAMSYDDAIKNIGFELYDFLDKPGNFEEDMECIIHEIQPVVPTQFTISQEEYIDQYWNGEEMVDSNPTYFLRIKYVGDSQ